MGRLDGRVCVVTEAKGGIGAATAQRFTAEGARVVGVDLDDGSPSKLAVALGSGCTLSGGDGAGGTAETSVPV